MDKDREAFEKWAVSNEMDITRADNLNKNYSFPMVQFIWAGFQAARALDAERIKELEIDLEGSDGAIDLMSKLLAKIALTLKGEPEPLKMHSYHDLPQLVEGQQKQLAAAEASIKLKDEALHSLKTQITNILKGIDCTELDREDGYWETSTGAEFGKGRLNAVIQAIDQAIEQALSTTPSDKG